MGVVVCIDHFVVGHSSLAELPGLPVDQLKIDRSFIGKIGEGGDKAELVRAIVALGRALSKQVLAEGIENARQLSVLQDLGCEQGQGFMLSPPLDPTVAGALVSSRGAD
jgi:EAL domain-containing protein (putative c-di-GMP-specific phosphodiesterase class I)